MVFVKLVVYYSNDQSEKDSVIWEGFAVLGTTGGQQTKPWMNEGWMMNGKLCLKMCYPSKTTKSQLTSPIISSNFIVPKFGFTHQKCVTLFLEAELLHSKVTFLNQRKGIVIQTSWLSGAFRGCTLIQSDPGISKSILKYLHNPTNPKNPTESLHHFGRPQETRNGERGERAPRLSDVFFDVDFGTDLIWAMIQRKYIQE